MHDEMKREKPKTLGEWVMKLIAPHPRTPNGCPHGDMECHHHDLCKLCAEDQAFQGP